MILLIGGIKGGVGKTTIATNLAVWLSGRGVDFALIDADHQRSSAKWAERRADSPAQTVFCPEKLGQGLYPFLVDIESRVGTVIVDAGGRDSVELRQALLAADVLYSPLAPSQLDIETLDELVETVRIAQAMNPALATRLLLSQVETSRGVDELRDARETLAEIAGEHPVLGMSEIIVPRRKVYRQAIREGLGVLEMNNPLARAEIEALAQEIFGDVVQP